MIKLATHEKKFRPRRNISSKIQALEVLEWKWAENYKRSHCYKSLVRSLKNFHNQPNTIRRLFGVGSSSWAAFLTRANWLMAFFGSPHPPCPHPKFDLEYARVADLWKGIELPLHPPKRIIKYLKISAI